MAISIQRGGGGGGGADPELVGGRLTLLAGTPASPYDQIGATTLRWTPSDRYGGVGSGRTTLWNGSALQVFTDASDITLALGTLTANALYDVFLLDTAGTRSLELQIWAGHGQAMTGATNATPIVVTAASHGLNNGDQVYVDGVRSSSDPTAPQVAPNGTHTVASAGATFALSGSVGSFDWYRGGYFSARLAAGLLTMQNGLLCKTGAPTKRYVGTIRTTATTTTEDSRAKRFVWNAYNRLERTLLKVDYDDHTIQNITPTGATGYRIWQEAGANSTRVEWVQGLAGMPTKLTGRGGSLASTTGSHIPFQLGIDGTPRMELVTSSNVMVTADEVRVSTFGGPILIQPGYHFADVMEAEHANLAGVCLQGHMSGTVYA